MKKGQKRRSKEDWEDLRIKVLKLYCEDKRSIREIHKLIPCCRDHVQKILRENNIQLEYNHGKRFKIYEHEKEIIDLYLKEKSTLELAKKFNCSLKPIRKILIKNNIKRRIDAGYFKKGNKIGCLAPRIEVYSHVYEVIKLYTQEFKNTREIAEIFGCGQSAICKILHKNNILMEGTLVKIPTAWFIKEYNEGSSLRTLSKKYHVSPNLIYRRLRRRGVKMRNHTEEMCSLISETRKRLYAEGILKSFIKGKTFEEVYGLEKARGLKIQMKERRAKQIIPLTDTSIEIRIQGFLQQLGVEHFTHWAVNEIEHAYQCDVFIPVQNKIPRKTVIECDGDYWHGNPLLFPEEKLTERQHAQKERDTKRTQELTEKDFRVLRLWENNIERMNLEDFKQILFNPTVQIKARSQFHV